MKYGFLQRYSMLAIQCYLLADSKVDISMINENNLELNWCLYLTHSQSIVSLSEIGVARALDELLNESLSPFLKKVLKLVDQRDLRMMTCELQNSCTCNESVDTNKMEQFLLRFGKTLVGNK